MVMLATTPYTGLTVRGKETRQSHFFFGKSYLYVCAYTSKAIPSYQTAKQSNFKYHRTSVNNSISEVIQFLIFFAKEVKVVNIVFCCLSRKIAAVDLCLYQNQLYHGLSCGIIEKISVKLPQIGGLCFVALVGRQSQSTHSVSVQAGQRKCQAT